MKKTMPQVLLLGNGINRAYGDKSWQDLIRALKTNEKISLDDEEIKKIPYPLQVILAARGNVNVRESNGLSSICGRENIDDMQPVLQKLYAIGFDDVLTANYSYELERSIQPKVKPDGKNLLRYQKNETPDGRAENKYLLHTYYYIPYGEFRTRIWHIHGEARKKNSIILDHYQYGTLLSRYQELLKKRENTQYDRQQSGETPQLKSWIDTFIMGDVYILGFGFNYSEFDLWWLLNRKQREKADTGKVYFYTVDPGSAHCALLETYGAEIVNMGYKRKPDDVVLLGLAAIGLIAVEVTRDEVERQETVKEVKTGTMKALQAKASAMAVSCNDPEKKKALDHMAEAFRYSDPVSSDATQKLEMKLEVMLDELQENGNADLVNRIESVLSERNQICKMSK